MNSSVFNFIAGVSAVGLLSVSPLRAVSIPASADTTVSSLAPAQNFGSSTTLTVDANNRVYIRFDFSNALPFGQNANLVEKAVLYVYVNKAIQQGGIMVSPACTEWSEQTLTDVNSPAACTEGVTKISVEESGRFVMADVT